MNAADFKALALDRLKQLDDAELHASMPSGPDADKFGEVVAQFRHARAAFPGRTWEEFTAISRRRSSPPRRGRPTIDPVTKASDPMTRASRDVQRIRDLWRELSGSRRNIPADPIDNSAKRHGVSDVELSERVRRPLSRR